jgi:cell division protein ZapE
MTPLKLYMQRIDQQGFIKDPAQIEALCLLERLHQALLSHAAPPRSGFWTRWRGDKVTEPEQGVYLWGGVGRGKTYIMDTFYETLPTDKRLRMHFHRFMQWVHQELAQLQGQKNPLEQVADQLAVKARVLCFDELFVSDITDAMLIGTLFEAIFKRGVSLVATSNCSPQELYRNGLQRARFMPAIALIERHCHVLEVDGGQDYRQRTLVSAQIYHASLDENARHNLWLYFDKLSCEPKRADGELRINGRSLTFWAEADSVLFTDFKALCEEPRSAVDYIELARLYHTVLIYGLPQLNEERDDAARRFIGLVDEFYERRVVLIIAAEVALEALYLGKRLAFEFKRCLSRLQEMQSQAYLAQEHKP